MLAWWKQVFAFDISALKMLGMETLDALGEHAAERLLSLLHGETRGIVEVSHCIVEALYQRFYNERSNSPARRR
jgi:hypothetical protein